MCVNKDTQIRIYMFLRLWTLTLFARFYIEGVPHNGTTTKSEQFKEKRGKKKKPDKKCSNTLFKKKKT